MFKAFCRFILAASLLVGTAVPSYALGKLQGYVEKGGQIVKTVGFWSSTKSQGSYPGASVYAYLAGTVTLATIYSDSALTPKANPFTAGTDASWSFYAADGDYDVKFCEIAGCATGAVWTLSGLRILSIEPNDVASMATGGVGTSASPWIGWEATVNALPEESAIYFRAGYYTLATAIVVQKGWFIYGDGNHATFIRANALAGSAFRSNYTLNASNVARNTYRDFQLTTTNASNNGSGIFEQAGTFVEISGVTISGFKSNLTLNQTEIAVIHNCFFGQARTMAMWIVNGGDYTTANGWDLNLPTASAGLTNRLMITSNQFDPGAGLVGLVDDGGLTHQVIGNNFNSGLNNIRLAGADGGSTYIGNEVEAATGTSIITAGTSYYGAAGVGVNLNITISANYIHPVAGQAGISLSGGGNYTINENTFNTNTTPVISTASATRVVGIANVQAGSSTLMFNSQGASWHFQADDLQGVVMVTNNKGVFFGGITFANLGTPANSTVKFCSDCTKTTPCAGAGTGALAVRINGAWDCNP